MIIEAWYDAISAYFYNSANNADSIFVYSNRLQLAVAIP